MGVGAAVGVGVDVTLGTIGAVRAASTLSGSAPAGIHTPAPVPEGVVAAEVGLEEGMNGLGVGTDVGIRVGVDARVAVEIGGMPVGDIRPE